MHSRLRPRPPLWGDHHRHAEVRAAVAAQLRARPALYQDFVVDGDSGGYAKFCTKVSMADEWGDHLTLQAAADAYSKESEKNGVR
eukprot:gene29673-biopygen77618